MSQREAIIPCSCCKKRQEEIEEHGDKFISCMPVPGDPEKCRIVWEEVD